MGACLNLVIQRKLTPEKTYLKRKISNLARMSVDSICSMFSMFHSDGGKMVGRVVVGKEVAHVVYYLKIFAGKTWQVKCYINMA